MILSSVTVSLVPESRGGPFVFWDDLPAACRAARELGFDAIEIFPPSGDALQPSAVRKLLDEHGLALAAMGTGAGWVKHKRHLCLPEASARREARDFIRRVVDCAGELGAPAIIGSMQGRSGEDVDAATARGYLAEALQELGEHAAQYKQPLLIEPLNRYETNLLNTVESSLALLQSLSTQNVKLLNDLFHMNIEEADIAHALRLAGDKVGHVHFVDSNRRPVGHGHLDIQPIAEALGRIGYEGFISAEAFPYPDPMQAASQTIRSFNQFFRPE